MKPRDFLNFFKTQSGKMVAFARLVRRGIDHFQRYAETPHGYRRRRCCYPAGHEHHLRQTPGCAVRRATDAAFSSATAQTVTGFTITSSSTPTTFTNSSPQPLLVCRRASRNRSRPSACLLTARPRSRSQKAERVFAPFGRLIPCETVITVDSSSIQTPIIGLVTEDIYRGQMLIPAGTEVHGMAKTDHQRERIAGTPVGLLSGRTARKCKLRPSPWTANSTTAPTNPAGPSPTAAPVCVGNSSNPTTWPTSNCLPPRSFPARPAP